MRSILPHIKIVPALLANVLTQTRFGTRTPLSNYESVLMCFLAEAGTGAHDSVITVREYIGPSGGQAITREEDFFVKEATDVTGVQNFTLHHGASFTAEGNREQLVVAEVPNTSLEHGSDHIQMRASPHASSTKIAAMLYILVGARYAVDPDEVLHA